MENFRILITSVKKAIENIFNVRIYKTYPILVSFCLVWFYGISNIIGHFMKPCYYKFMICKHILLLNTVKKVFSDNSIRHKLTNSDVFKYCYPSLKMQLNMSFV